MVEKHYEDGNLKSLEECSTCQNTWDVFLSSGGRKETKKVQVHQGEAILQSFGWFAPVSSAFKKIENQERESRA